MQKFLSNLIVSSTIVTHYSKLFSYSATSSVVISNRRAFVTLTFGHNDRTFPLGWRFRIDSLTIFGHFLKVLATNLFTKVAQTLGNYLWALLKHIIFSVKTSPWLLFGPLSENLATFLPTSGHTVRGCYGTGGGAKINICRVSHHNFQSHCLDKNSVTRLGYFWKILVTIFFAKVGKYFS